MYVYCNKHKLMLIHYRLGRRHFLLVRNPPRQAEMDCAPAKKLENLTQQGFNEFLHQQFEAVCFGHLRAMNMLGYVLCIASSQVWISLDKFGSSEVWRRCG